MGHPGELTPPGPTPTIPKLDLSGSFMSFAASRATLLSASAIRGGAKPKLLTTVASSQRRIPGYTGHMPTREYNSGRSFGYLEAHDLECKTFRETTGYDFLSSLSSREGRAETMTGSMTVRGDQFTRAEEEVLKAKFKDRRPYDPQRKDLLAGGYMATPRTSRTLTSEQVEATWLKTPERTARERMRNLVPERPGSPEGKHPQQHGPETNRVIAEDYIRRFDLPRGALDPAMDKSWGPSDADVGWTVGCDYEVPKGWIGMGLHVPDWAQARRCFTNWQTVFYPLPSEHLETVLRTGQIPIPGDTLVDGTIAKVVHLTHLGLCEKRDPNTARKDRSATRIYTTPSIRYARMKVAALTRNGGFILHQGKRLAFVLMCKQKATPSSKGGYHICEETIGFSERPGKDKREQISPHFLNNQIEYYTLNRASVVPYRLLISVEEDDAVPTWHDVKWRREDQPTLGASTIPGLGLPYTAFDAPGVERDRREGGLVAPRPKIPYVSFPETRAPRDPNTDAALRVSTQPHEPEAMLMPSKGWRDATIPEGLKHSNRMKARSLKRVLQEMKDAFMINGSSMGIVFERLRAISGREDMRREDLAKLLLRLNIVHSIDEAIIDEVWEHLDEDGGGSISIREFTERFGILGRGGEILNMFRQKVAGQFSKIAQAFQIVDIDRSGSIDKKELRRMFDRFGLLNTVTKAQYDELWDFLDTDGTGDLSYQEFVKKFSGGSGEIAVAYGIKGPAAGNRRIGKAPGTLGHQVSRICDEGSAYYAQMDFEKAEACYRKALSMDPNHIAALCSLAWMLRNHKNDFLGARGLMRRACESDPSNPYINMQLQMY